jgi:hypothetical protein
VANPADALTIQFLQWVAAGPRSYAEVMEAWRTSCPRLTIWEDALLDGLVQYAGGDRKTIALTPAGRRELAAAE